MIRINLLERRQDAPAGTREKPKGASLEIGGLGPLLVVLILAVGLAFVGWRYLSLNHQISTLNEGIAKADQRIAELDKALKTMDEFQAKKKTLEHRVQLISDLKRKQDVPVLMLDVLSRQVPDFLWIDTMKEKGPGELQIDGKAMTFNAVSNLYNNLKDSPFFSDVQLGGGAGRGGDQGDVVAFGLSCKFIPPKPGEDTDPAVNGAVAAQPAAGTSANTAAPAAPGVTR